MISNAGSPSILGYGTGRSLSVSLLGFGYYHISAESVRWIFFDSPVRHYSFPTVARVASIIASVRILSFAALHRFVSYMSIDRSALHTGSMLSSDFHAPSRDFSFAAKDTLVFAGSDRLFSFQNPGHTLTFGAQERLTSFAGGT